MGFTKRELIQFFDRLTELIGKGNKRKAKAMVRRFRLDFEAGYQYENGEMQKDVSYLPPFYIAAMSQSLQDEIKQKVTARLAELGEYSPEMVECAMCSKIYDLGELIEINDYVRWANEEVYRDFSRKLEASR